MTIKKILVANRGEIALRVIRTCQRLGIETVLASSEADMESLPAKQADRTLCIGPARSTDSYLKMETLVEAAIGVKADAVHPGYGFLSERSAFARNCEEHGVIFIGPTAEQIESVGDKLKARHHAELANVPVVPGGPVETAEEAVALADRIGFPILIKAVGGGGGRGMKRVDSMNDLLSLMHLAQGEASAAFGDARVYLERFVTRGRHVEVQLLGDGADVIHLGDRDCSIQRRFQKLVEEAPAPNIPAPVRKRMHDAAVRFGRHLKYRSLGTVEFLYDVDRDDFFFLEMNARIQVEHPVTEMITGLDLVEQQICVANGERLGFSQKDIKFSGAAIECRLNAEDIEQDFRPCPGTLTQVEFPSGEGIRVDTHIAAGQKIPPFYDSMMAKLIVHKAKRASAVAAMGKALELTRIEGVKTNRDLHIGIMADPQFMEGGVDTGFLPGYLERKSQIGKN